jgi:hypothetical protein
MSRATPKLRAFAKRLIAHETRGNKSFDKKSAAFLFNDRLRPQLTELMGTGGFRALLSRALALANVDVAWLRAVHVKADGSLEGLDELAAQVEADEVVEGGVALLAQLLGLLVAFVGEDLTLRLVREAWPKLPLNSLAVGKGD